MAILHFFTKAEHRELNRPELDSALLATPSLALMQAQLVADDLLTDILSLADFVSNLPTMYQKGCGKATKAHSMGSNLHYRLTRLYVYLLKLSNQTLSTTDSYTLYLLLESIDELSEITAHLMHIADVSKCLSKLKRPLTFAAQRELTEIWTRLDIILKKLQEAFLKGNSITGMGMCRQNAILKEHIKVYKKNHIHRLRAGKCNIETGICFLDLLFDYEQIALHCTSLFGEAFVMDSTKERNG